MTRLIACEGPGGTRGAGQGGGRPRPDLLEADKERQLALDVEFLDPLCVVEKGVRVGQPAQGTDPQAHNQGRLANSVPLF